ncbi:MAG: MASE1 domain-containing protein [Pseudolabrys sp.]|nr:MASE1 domain-containing protein [Pseudolabrys sp.]
MKKFPFAAVTNSRAPGATIFLLVVVGLAYFLLARLGLQLASINPSASPIWPATGLALAAVLLGGVRVWPAILIAAFAANAVTAGTPATAAFIAVGNTLEAVVGGFLVMRWSGGRDTFSTPAQVVKFALIVFGAATVISATVGVVTLCVAGLAPWANFWPIWITWWLGDAAGALVVTPVIVLWALTDLRSLNGREVRDIALALGGTVAVGLIAFSPLLPRSEYTSPLAFLAILPLLWSALRRGPRDTATVALILTAFTIWATRAQAGPFAGVEQNETFVLLLTFIISVTVPSLALSADVAVRRTTEDNLRRTFSDLDQNQRQRTALSDANIHLKDAQRLANLGSWSWDIPENKVVWSDQLCDIYGITRARAPTKVEDFVDFLHPDDRDKVQASIGKALESGTDFSHDERILRPDGSVRHLQSVGEVVRDDSGAPLRMLGVCLDVTEQREAQVTLEQTREQLAQSQKMEALGQLTGGIAHDFNNLLMIVSGYAQILQRRLKEPRDAQAVEAIRAAASRGEKLTRQLLTFSRRQQLMPVVVDLHKATETVHGLLAPSLQGNIAFVSNIANDVWRVAVDLGEFELALVNLAVNARDAMPDGGTITLTARNVVLDSDAATGGLSGDFVALSVSDSGIGIAPDVLHRVFEPFFTTKPVGKGTGLGLSQVHGFANLSGGAVTVTSEVGLGTAVTIYLPRARAEMAAEAEEGAAPVNGHAQGTVLVVEDSREVAEVTTALLDQLGYRVVRAENAAEALGYLESETAFDLVFSDIVMPGAINGLGLADMCRQRFPGLPVLLTSGFSEAALAPNGRFEILRKPFDLAALEQAIEATRGRAARG